MGGNGGRPNNVAVVVGADVLALAVVVGIGGEAAAPASFLFCCCYCGSAMQNLIHVN